MAPHELFIGFSLIATIEFGWEPHNPWGRHDMGQNLETKDPPFRLIAEPAHRPKRRRGPLRPIMPWGKYKGIHLDQIPLDYLRWLDDSQKLTPYLRRQVQKELAKWN